MTFDKDYQRKAIDYNVQRTDRWFTQQRAEMQAIQVAFTHGLVSGAYYGGAVGVGSAIYFRKMRKIPIYAFATGVSYGLALASSAWFRMDI